MHVAREVQIYETLTGVGIDCMRCDKNTGRFIMFSVITNIYNKKTKGPTLLELFTGTGKLKVFFLTTRDVRCVQHGWHGTHRYDIQVLATHTWRGTTLHYAETTLLLPLLGCSLLPHAGILHDFECFIDKFVVIGMSNLQWRIENNHRCFILICCIILQRKWKVAV